MKFLNFLTNINLVLGSLLCWNENDIGEIIMPNMKFYSELF